jgi:dTDP-4-dehydrorhamnose 3,5-epimerase
VIFTPAPIAGACVLAPEARRDERGSFARVWCAREFADHGLETRIAQISTSFNLRRGTLRGMHYQVAPHEEVKLVRCTRGRIHDVIVDLRPGSATYLKHFALELTPSNGLQLYIPAGCAHGFQTLEDASEICYQMSAFYEPAAQRGVRWNDPALGITWPIADPILNPRDAAYPDLPAARAAHA